MRYIARSPAESAKAPRGDPRAMPEETLDKEYMRRKWARSLPMPSVAVIVGRRGGGKSAALYRLAQDRSRDEGVPAYVIGLPLAKWDLAPPGVQPVPFEALQGLENAVVAIDEAGMRFYYRAWGDDPHEVMDRLVSVSRQKRLLILFAVHTLRKLDVALVLDADAVIYKEPSFMHARLERREVRRMSQEALEKFQSLPVADRRRYAYVFSHEDQGVMLQNDLPEGWSEELSVAFAGIDLQAGIKRADGQSGIGGVIERAAEAEARLEAEAAENVRRGEIYPQQAPPARITAGPVDPAGSPPPPSQIGREIDAVRRAHVRRELSDEEMIEEVVATFQRNRQEVLDFLKKKEGGS